MAEVIQADWKLLDALDNLEWLSVDYRPNPSALDIIAAHRQAAELSAAKAAIEAAARVAKQELTINGGKACCDVAGAIRALDPEAILGERKPE